MKEPLPAISHYRIVSKIGAGGMGEVYLAEDTQLERQVALKVLHPEIAGDEERVRRFVQEAKAASALNHPNILTVYEIGHSENLRFIATELIKGETLRDRLRGGPLTLRETLDVALQVAAALNAAHQAGIVHRDIKPENIMLRDDGLAKVLDFGLAKLTEKKSETTSSEDVTRVHVNTSPGLVMGTVAYMSPEQSRGKEVDSRSDIWSLGVVIYEMLTRRTPFAEETTSDAIAAILTRDPAPLDANTPQELQRIIRKSLQRRPDERYQTIKDFQLDIKTLKRELDFSEELERSQIPAFTRSSNVSTTQTENATAPSPAISTQDSSPNQTSSAEYLISEIKRHKRGVAVALAVLLFGAIGAGYLFFDNRVGISTDTAPIDSIAVLPFENTRQDPNTEYLSDGLTENLINTLSRIQSLRVMPRSTVFRYKGKSDNPQQIGAELKVRAVLTGKVVQRDNQLQIQTELIDISSGAQIWGEQYNRKLSDVLAMQDEIAREISDRLRLKLSGEQQRQLTKRYTENTEAYQLYLKGRYYTAKLTKDGLQKGNEYFDQALEKDPNYALAYGGRAGNYILASEWFILPKEAVSKTREAAKKALAIDESLADPHASLALVAYWYDWDWTAADREFKRAIELDPSDARTRGFYSWFLVSVGRTDQALAEAKRGQELDPISAEITAFRGLTLFLARQNDQAIVQFRKAVDLDPTYFFAHLFLGQALEEQGKLAEAIAEIERARQLEGEIAQIWAMLGHVYALSGRRIDAQRIIAELKDPAGRVYVPSYLPALVYAGLGDKDEAFAWLERAYSERSAFIAWFVPVDPVWDNLRSDPRFAELLRKVGFQQ